MEILVFFVSVGVSILSKFGYLFIPRARRDRGGKVFTEMAQKFFQLSQGALDQLKEFFVFFADPCLTLLKEFLKVLNSTMLESRF